MSRIIVGLLVLTAFLFSSLAPLTFNSANTLSSNKQQLCIFHDDGCQDDSTENESSTETAKPDNWILSHSSTYFNLSPSTQQNYLISSLLPPPHFFISNIERPPRT